MRVGQKVIVTDFKENQLLREVVALEGGFVYVARPDEIQEAKNNFREPNCIGFPVSDVKSVSGQK